MKHMKKFNEGYGDEPRISSVSILYTYYFDQNPDGIDRIECYNQPESSQTTEWKLIDIDNDVLWTYEGYIDENNIDELIADGELDEEFIDYIKACVTNFPLEFM
ncbi:MAG: hypothetical protein HPY57_14105 [Ignavibacteria bacterium]|nr:hypothetical protein [Ignavibacteria bacterium]